MTLTKELTDLIEENNYSIYDGGDYLEFQRYSSAGQDFSFCVDCNGSIDELMNNIIDYYMGFDVSYETSLWIGEDGHGKNGAPYEIKDICADMEECREFINELFRIVKSYADKTRR